MSPCCDWLSMYSIGMSVPPFTCLPLHWSSIPSPAGLTVCLLFQDWKSAFFLPTVFVCLPLVFLFLYHSSCSSCGVDTPCQRLPSCPCILLYCSSIPLPAVFCLLPVLCPPIVSCPPAHAPVRLLSPAMPPSVYCLLLSYPCLPLPAVS